MKPTRQLDQMWLRDDMTDNVYAGRCKQIAKDELEAGRISEKKYAEIEAEADRILYGPRPN